MYQKILFSGVALLLLAGCQTNRSEVLLTPRKEVSYLTDKTPKQIRSLLGKPCNIRTESPYQLWTYYGNQCNTFVYFGPENLSAYAETRGPCKTTMTQR